MSDVIGSQLRAEDKKKNKAAFFKRIDDNVLEMISHLSELPSVKMSDFNKENTVLVVIDAVNGFVKKGNMFSERIADIVPTIINIIDMFNENSMKIIALADCHSKDSSELAHFPEHCIEGTDEAEIIDEIKQCGGYELILKNSVNGFFAPDFRSFLEKNSNIDTFVVCGDCTDICVMNFCLTLKAYFDQSNQSAEIIVPIDSVETYDNNSTHNGDLMNIVALEMMGTAGIKIVNSIEAD